MKSSQGVGPKHTRPITHQQPRDSRREYRGHMTRFISSCTVYCIVLRRISQERDHYHVCRNTYERPYEIRRSSKQQNLLFWWATAVAIPIRSQTVSTVEDTCNIKVATTSSMKTCKTKTSCSEKENLFLATAHAYILRVLWLWGSKYEMRRVVAEVEALQRYLLTRCHRKEILLY